MNGLASNDEPIKVIRSKPFPTRPSVSSPKDNAFFRDLNSRGYSEWCFTNPLITDGQLPPMSEKTLPMPNKNLSPRIPFPLHRLPKRAPISLGAL